MASQKWSKEENNTLKKLYPLYLRREIQKTDLKSAFPNRTWTALMSRTATIDARQRFKDGVLRKCNVCGFEAKNNDDLKFFAKDPRYKYNRKNIFLSY